MATYAMGLDLADCIGCKTCVISCKMYNGTRPGIDYNQVQVVDWGEFPDAEQGFVLTMCNHCEEPPCVPVCPVDATHKEADGTVLVDYDKCIGCGACVSACPYGQRFMVDDDVTNFEGFVAPYEEESKQRLKIVEKCTFCHPRVVEGLAPMCVEHCPGQCRIFGDLDVADSPISEFIKQDGVEQLGGTQIYYRRPEGMPTDYLPDDLATLLAAAPTEDGEKDEPTTTATKPADTAEAEDGGDNTVKIVAGVAGAAAVAAAGGYAYKRSKDNKAADTTEEE